MYDLIDWVDQEIEPWTQPGLIDDDLSDRAHAYSRNYTNKFFYRIVDGRVQLDEKLDFLGLDRNSIHFAPIMRRANSYRDFIQAVCLYFDIRISCDFVIDVDDLGTTFADIPIFRFQKQEGQRELLLPDVDLLGMNYYLDFDDPRPYSAKDDVAMFVGSTTGEMPITRGLIQENRHQRICSALYFKSVDDVHFTLPNIVQYDTLETLEYIRSLGISGEVVPFSAQLAARHIISQDGNGATCSRVVQTLLSNSILLKYVSINHLHYFKGLTPWRDYIPIFHNGDVPFHIGQAKRHPEYYEIVSENGRAFAARYLSRLSTMQYTGLLLEKYAALTRPRDPVRASRTTAVNIDASAHVAFAGSIWSDLDRWAGRPASGTIEGFRLYPDLSIDPAELRYCSVDANGKVEGEVSAFEYCGTIGQSQPIYGMRVALGGEARRRCALQIDCEFADGSRKSKGDGDVIRAAAPLKRFRVTARARR